MLRMANELKSPCYANEPKNLFYNTLKPQLFVQGGYWAYKHSLFAQPSSPSLEIYYL